MKRVMRMKWMKRRGRPLGLARAAGDACQDNRGAGTE